MIKSTTQDIIKDYIDQSLMEDDYCEIAAEETSQAIE